MSGDFNESMVLSSKILGFGLLGDAPLPSSSSSLGGSCREMPPLAEAAAAAAWAARRSLKSSVNSYLYLFIFSFIKAKMFFFLR
jgi:hypothetical protein